MTIVDSHHHLWRYDPAAYPWIDSSMHSLRRDFLHRELTDALSEFHISATVAVQAREIDAETEWLLTIAEHSDSIAGVVGWIDLQAPDLEAKLAKYEGRRKLKGFRHVLQGENDRALLLREPFLAGLRTVAAHGYCYDMLVSPDQLRYVEEACQRVPELRIVLDHIGKPRIGGPYFDHGWAQEVRSLAANSSAHCKLSGMVTEAQTNAPASQFVPYIETAIDSFGDGRLMYGSDWPVCLLSRSYSEVVDVLRRYERTSGAILGESFWSLAARRFYSLDDVDGTTTAA